LIPLRRVKRHFERVVAARKNCSFHDLNLLLLAIGFRRRKAKGSHVFFYWPDVALSVPARNPVREVCVDQAIEIATKF
jgi:hypothetical protein